MPFRDNVYMSIQILDILFRKFRGTKTQINLMVCSEPMSVFYCYNKGMLQVWFMLLCINHFHIFKAVFLQ